MVKVKRDLTGQTFGRLTVIKQAEDYIDKKGKHYAQWLCKCNCENETEIIVRGQNLISRNTMSCGCYQDECRIENNKKYKKKYNTYDLSGEYGIGYTSKGEEFYFDLEDYDKIKGYYWDIGTNGYVRAPNAINDYKLIKMHKVVVYCVDDFVIDHINHNLKDNRKCNLRIVTRSQNQMNAKLRVNNTSGITGVSWHKGINKWIAYININKKRVSLGAFDIFEDAVKARKDGEEKYFGEFSYDNSIGDINEQQTI